MILVTGARAGRAALAAAVLSAVIAPAAALAEDGVRFVRSVSGSRATPRGSSFDVEDERTVFTVPEDAQVVVYFELEAPPGRHRFVGRWRDPSGTVVAEAPQEKAPSGRRVGVLWRLALPPSAAAGTWTLEATANGAAAGTHSFEVRPGVMPALEPAALFQRGRHAVAVVERVAAGGEVQPMGAASALDADTVAVAFSADAASAAFLRLRFADGRTASASGVQAMGSAAGWTLLRVPGHGLTVLPRGGTPSVGDRVYVIEARGGADRVIAEHAIVGEDALPGGARGLRLAELAVAGAPVLTERGELAGIVVAGPETAAERSRAGYGGWILRQEVLGAGLRPRASP